MFLRSAEDDVSSVFTSTSSAQAYTTADDLCLGEVDRATSGNRGSIWIAGKDKRL